MPATPEAPKAKEPMAQLKKYLFIMGAVTVTITAGMAAQPVGEFIFTWKLREKVAINSLSIFSQNQETNRRLKAIETTLKGFTDNRDKQLVALALQAFNAEQQRLAKLNP